ncbi:MAG TPA: radical SAM protein [Gemmataceae bacterium]|nr:radical SAM protein [Gemmataceae bacterium]
MLQRSGTPLANRQIYLVHPKFPPSYWGMEEWLGLTVYDAIYPPLGMLTLGALTQKEFQVTLCDENAGENVNYDTEAEIVGITGYVNQMHKAFEHADNFRARGKLVVMGGPLANLLPDQCRKHCDVLFEGEAEYTWPQFLQEYTAGKWSQSYQQEEKIHLPDSPMPRLDLMRRRYAHGIVQTTRGCPFTCEFCDIIVMYGRKMRVKPVEQVMAEIQAWKDAGFSMVFFSDDNFVGNRAYSKELLRTVADWNKRQPKPMSFYTQASIDMVRDDELLELMRSANFVSVFIGIESPRKESLAETHKTQNVKLDLVKAVHKVQSYGMFVYAGMIVGFDADDATIFDEQFNFLQEADIAIVMTGVLVAVPKTPLYHRLEAAGRLRNSDDPGDYGSMTNGQTNIVPMHMTMKELARGQESLYRRLYSPKAFSKRLVGNLKRFRRMRYRPEHFRLHYLGTMQRMIRHYWSKGWPGRKFFLNIVWKTLQHSPRSLRPMLQFMGMYKHFCEVNAKAMDWDPWEPEPLPARS